ncbi:MAG: ABC transporter permease [Prochlorococcaceae cyanobacterium]
MILTFPRALWKQRELWWRLSEREVLGRYRGSILGIGWSFLNPLAMLAVYTLVFSQVFKARWGTHADMGPLGFAINLFAGLIVFNLAAECLNQAPGIVVSNPNYVKKIIFPLEVLGSVTVGSAFFHAFASLIVLVVFELIATHAIPITILWLPLVWIPLLLALLAATWALAALGVFIRDIGQIVNVFMSMLMFLSPIFFPASALPPRWQPLLALNPLSFVIEETRAVTVEGRAPSMSYLILGTVFGVIMAELSLRGFSKAKRAFADVM